MQEQIVKAPVVSKDFTMEDVLNVKKYFSLRNQQIPLEQQIAEAKAAHKRFDDYMSKLDADKAGDISHKKEE
jgi:hypothetical protein